MQLISFTSPERLEDRIAPAGMVTVTFSNGLLSIAGTDGADHDVSVVKTGENSFRVEGDATGINALGTTSKNYRGELKAVLIEGGAGDDSFELRNLSPLKSLRFTGNAGVDELSTANLKTRPDGVVAITMGVDGGSVDLHGGKTLLKGALNVDLGGGGAVEMSSGLTKISGAVSVTGGAGNDALLLSGTKTVLLSKLTFQGNEGADSLETAGTRLIVKGLTSFNGGNGANDFDVHTARTSLTGLSINGGNDRDTVSIVTDGIIAGNTNVQLGADGTGTSSTALQSKTGMANGLQFGRNLTIEMAGATVDTLAMANIQVGKIFVAQTGAGVSTVNIARLNVLGDFKLETGAGADVVNVDNVITQAFYLDTQAGADELRIERNAAYAGKSLVNGMATILTSEGADQIRIGQSSDPTNLKVSFRGAVNVDTGDGANMRNGILEANGFASAPTIVSTGGTLTQTEAV